MKRLLKEFKTHCCCDNKPVIPTKDSGSAIAVPDTGGNDDDAERSKHPSCGQDCNPLAGITGINRRRHSERWHVGLEAM